MGSVDNIARTTLGRQYRYHFIIRGQYNRYIIHSAMDVTLTMV